MATEKKVLLYCFFLLNLAVLIAIVNFAGSYRTSSNTNSKMVTLAILNAPATSQNLRGSRNTDFASEIAAAIEDPEIDPSDTTEDPEEDLPTLPMNGTEDSVAPLHPFEQLANKLEQLGWDPVRIDEVIRKYWDTDKSFIRYKVGREKQINTILSTSCLHTAAWIVTGLLELQRRPNYYRGLYRLPENKDLIVYDNTGKPPSTQAAPVIESLRNFINSHPKNESIVLQVDMQQLLNYTGPYIDHHFALHVYNGSISLYQGWQDVFNLIEWMQKPEAFSFRYPMPIETFLGHFEKVLSYDHEKGDFDRERLEHTWKIFGITDTFTFGQSRMAINDPVVRPLRFQWIVSLITHWPSPPQLNGPPMSS